MNSKKINILTQSHLCRNPRVVKEAITLAQSGYEVKIITTFYDDKLFLQDLDLIKNTTIQLIAAVDLRKKSLSNFWLKFERKLSVLLIEKIGFETPKALGYGFQKYMQYVKNNNANLYICHQELATYVGIKLAKKGKKVAFDIEDWYSKDLLPEAQKKRPIKLLESTERAALQLGTCWTTSESLAKELANYYQSSKPYTIYNVFPKPILKVNNKKNEIFKLFWFSQTIGEGRGLEEIIIGLVQLESSIELHLLGNVSLAYQNKLLKIIENKFKVYFHQIVEVQKLPQFIAQFNLGLALELYKPESRNCTITNKFFQYLQSGLPILASNTKGQKEILDKFKIGELIKLGELNWTKQLLLLIEDKSYYQSLKKNVILFAEEYNWENEQKKLLAIIKNILSPL
jgi:glycosyltransferase involved in cell wall biosynthesis